MNIAAIGAISLGIVVGWLIRYFLLRFEKFNSQVLGSTLSLLTGGVVIGFFGIVDPEQDVIWFYPIGVLVGFVIYSVTARLSGAPSKGSMYYVKKDTGSKTRD